MMSDYWWKIPSAFLVLATLIFGLRTPLAPGVPEVSPDQLNNGVTGVTITGYNTHFEEAKEDLKVWVVNGDATFCPYELAVVDDTHLRATFSITGKIENSFFDLYVNNPVDGTLFLPNAFLQNGLEVSLTPDKTKDCVGELAADPGRFDFPNQPILYETIRNIYYHVPSWFAMLFVMSISLIFSIMNLSTGKFKYDMAAAAAAHVGLLFAFIGLGTGSLWARFTWGAWWVSDPRLNGAAMAVLIYLAYFILKSSVNDKEKAARLGGVYNIFAYVMMIVFVMVLPRMMDSLHPGAGGNPAFSKYDLDNNMRMIFYPAVAGWIGVAVWIFQIKYRIARLNFKQEMDYENK